MDMKKTRFILFFSCPCKWVGERSEVALWKEWNTYLGLEEVGTTNLDKQQYFCLDFVFLHTTNDNQLMKEMDWFCGI